MVKQVDSGIDNVEQEVISTNKVVLPGTFEVKAGRSGVGHLLMRLMKRGGTVQVQSVQVQSFSDTRFSGAAD